MKKLVIIFSVFFMQLGFAQVTDTGDEVGIGTTAPILKLDVTGPTYFRSAPTHSVISEQIRFGRVDNNIRYHSIYSNHSGTPSLNYLQIRVHNGNSVNLAEQETVMTLNGSGKLGIGTTTPDEKLSVNGNIHTKEVRVDLTGWSDFVFEENYDLPTLEEVEKHIKNNGHLKDMPSAEKVAKDGIFLGEMDSKLLQKIEELTLYTINQEKRIKDLESKNQKLMEIVEKLLKEN